MDFLTDPVFSDFGRSDFIGGIDNEALDFGQLEQFIHVAVTTGSQPNDSPVAINPSTIATGPPSNTIVVVPGSGAPPQSHLPESPPDSGSEPPYSPADLQVLTLSANQIARGNNGNNGERNGNRGSNQPPNGNQQITINHSAIAAVAVPSNHVNSIATPVSSSLDTSQTQADLTGNITTLTDISQTSIDDLQTIGELHSHHQSHHNVHHSLLAPHHNNHFSHHQQQQQQPQQTNNLNALYIRTNESPETQNTQQNGTISIRKHENSLHEAHQNTSDQQLILQQTVGVTFLDLERSCRNDLISNNHPHQTILGPSMAPINTEDLSRMIPEVYTGAPHPGSPVAMATTRLNLKTPGHCRKRKLPTSDTGTSIVKPEPGSSLSPVCTQHMEPDSPIGTSLTAVSSNISIPDTSLDSTIQNPDSGGNGDPCPLQCIRFTPFQQQNWHVLCDQSLHELPVPHYRIDADKGFNFSNSDDAFVCQKKNHFQITCHAQLQGAATFVRTSSGLEKIKSFYLHFYGVKFEAPTHMIRVEQSQSDRSKKPFHPVPIDLQDRLVSKVTVGRLHFSETTSNNMRKKGRPNPEQRYFQLVVGLHAHTHSGHFPVVSQGSEKIIVRASNPGQFESDVELCWSRGATQDSIFHAGRVGINTDRPDESLVVHGNIKISGHIVQPSDSRAKQEITELDTSEQLKNLQKIRVVKYRYEPEFAIHSGLKDKNDSGEIIDTGVIAQEVREVLPDAVHEAGSIVLSNGHVIENFLLVNKDRILMENIGAVKELCKVTGSLETRIEQLEKINSRLVRMQQLDRNYNCDTKKCKHLTDNFDNVEEICSNKTIQIIIIVLVIIMASCLVAISTLYFVEHSKQGGRYIARYDRYDVSQYISQDAILINNNAPTNRNGYYIDRRANNQANSMDNTLLNPFTSRPQTSSVLHTKIISSSEDPLQEVTTHKHSTSYKIDGNDNSENERILNKNGIKWSSPSNEGGGPSETSSEKIIADPILLPQDVENNSIDGDHTQKPRMGSHKKNSGKKVSSTTHKPSNDTSSSVEFNKEIPPITNKSRADTEDTDLQYLSNNSETDDQTVFELSPNPTSSRTIQIEPIGLPAYCKNSMKDAAECQSVCCKEPVDGTYPNDAKGNFEIEIKDTNTTTKNLQPPQKIEQPVEIHNREAIFVEIDEVKKSLKLTETEIKAQNDHKQIQAAGQHHHLLHHHHHHHQDCFPMTVWIRSETFNVSLGAETFCLNSGHNLNMTYSVPLSKYMKENKIELHFMGPNRLQWILCSNKQRTVTHDYAAKECDISINNINSRKLFQKNPNKSLFYINLPSHGFFECQVVFRATINSTKNTCQEQADNTSNILEYNFRIFRDCDK